MDPNHEIKTEQMSDDCNQSASIQLKTCTDCRTTRTPLWRVGPEGPKTLCNACGIKYWKKKKEILGIDTGARRKEQQREKMKKQKRTTTSAAAEEEDSSSRNGEMLKLTAGLFGEKMYRRLKKKLGGNLKNLKEEEHAAILLMALSCGSVY